MSAAASRNPGHPEGLFDALQFARDMLLEHGLHDWTVRWDRAKRRAGCCVHSRKEITLSRPLTALYPTEAVQGVVLHEVAHALAGPAHQHDAYWKKIAVALGAPPHALLPASLPAPATAWEGRCLHCGPVKQLHAMPRRVVSCGRCSATFRPDLVLTWQKDGVPTEPTGAYAQELRRIRRRYR